jgi:hypothetical protein
MSLPIQRIPILQNQTLNQSDAIVTEPVFRNDILNKLIFTGVPVNGVLTQIINILNTAHNYIRRNNNLNFSSSVVSIGDATYTYVKAPSTRKSAAVTLVNDYLFCVNSSAELFQVNPLNGQLTYLSDQWEVCCRSS